MICAAIIGGLVGLLLSTKFKLPYYDRYEQWVERKFFGGKS